MSPSKTPHRVRRLVLRRLTAPEKSVPARSRPRPRFLSAAPRQSASPAPPAPHRPDENKPAPGEYAVPRGSVPDGWRPPTAASPRSNPLGASALPPTSFARRDSRRTEFFNFPNHVNFNLPNGTFSSPSFGKVTSATPARQIQFGLRFGF